MPGKRERERERGKGEATTAGIVTYWIAATFQTREEGQEPHNKIKRIINEDESLDVSSFLFEKRPQDPNQPRLQRPWHLVILGGTPPEPRQQQFQEILGGGELTQVPLETIVTLARRRVQEARPGEFKEMQHGQEWLKIPEVGITFRGNKGQRRRHRKR